MNEHIDADKLIAELERWRDKEKENYHESIYSMGRCDALAEFRNYIVSLMEEHPEKIVQPKVTTKGWVAKDYNGAIRLFFLCKPQRIDDKRYRYWYGGPNASKQLPNDSFPDLKWEDEPIEVELSIS